MIKHYRITPVPEVACRMTLKRSHTDHETVVRVLDAQKAVLCEFRVPSKGGQPEQPTVIPFTRDTAHIEVEGETDDRILVRFEDTRCGCIGSEHWCSHEGRCDEPVEGCGGSTNYCTECYLNARAEDAGQNR